MEEAKLHRGAMERSVGIQAFFPYLLGFLRCRSIKRSVRTVSYSRGKKIK